jgi:hypothetical protein
MPGAGRKPRVTDEEILDLFRETADPVLSTAEIADALPIGRRGVLDRLHNLADEGKLGSKNIGGRNIVWWRTESNDIATSSSSEGVKRRPEPEPETEPEQSSEVPDVDDVDGETLAEEVREYLDENDIPPKTAHGRDAVMDVFWELRKHGTRATGDLQDYVYPTYEDYWSDGRGMWNAIDRHLDAIPGIEKGGYGEWSYTSDEDVLETIR